MNPAGIALLGQVTKAVSGKSIAEHISQALSGSAQTGNAQVENAQSGNTQTDQVQTGQAAHMLARGEQILNVPKSAGFAALLQMPTQAETGMPRPTDVQVPDDAQPDGLRMEIAPADFAADFPVDLSADIPVGLPAPFLKTVAIPGFSGVELTAEKVTLATELRAVEAGLKSEILTNTPTNDGAEGSARQSTADTVSTPDMVPDTLGTKSPSLTGLDGLGAKVAQAVQNVLSGFDTRTGGNSLSVLAENLTSISAAQDPPVSSQAQAQAQGRSQNAASVSAQTPEQGRAAVLENVFSAVSKLVGVERAVIQSDTTSSQTLLMSRLPGLGDLTAQSGFGPRTVASMSATAGPMSPEMTLQNSQTALSSFEASPDRPTAQWGQTSGGQPAPLLGESDADVGYALRPTGATPDTQPPGAPAISTRPDSQTSGMVNPATQAVLEKIAGVQPAGTPVPSPSSEILREAVQMTQLAAASEPLLVADDVMPTMPETAKPVLSEVSADKTLPGSPSQSADGKQTSRFFGVLATQIKDIKFFEARTRIELNPAGLGGIEVDMTPDDTGRLHVVVRADNAMVLETLRNDRETLALLLSDQGEGLDMGDLDFEEFQQRSGPDEGEGSESGSESEGLESEADPLTHQQTITGEMLDIMT